MAVTVRIEREARERARDLVQAVGDRGLGAEVSLTSVRVFLEAIDHDFARWIGAIEATDDVTRMEWRVLALRNSLPAFVSLCARSVPVTATALVSAWIDAAATVGIRISFKRRPIAPRPQPKPTINTVTAFDAGVLEYTAKIVSTHDVASTIQRLMAHLQLSYDDVGRMVGHSGETVRRWEHGRSAPSAENQSILQAADAALSRLLSLFKADALPAVIRKSAEIFGNERALDWLLRGRIAEVADRYEHELSFQR